MVLVCRPAAVLGLAAIAIVAGCGRHDSASAQRPAPSATMAAPASRAPIASPPASNDLEVRALRAELQRVENERDRAVADLAAARARERALEGLLAERARPPGPPAAAAPARTHVFTTLSTSPSP